MFEDFQLAAIIRERSNTRLLRIPLHQGLQDTLVESWQAQYEAFVNEIDEIDFNAGYQPEAHERFRLEDYTLPEFLAGENRQSVPDLDAITMDDALLDSTKGLVAYVRTEGGQERGLFQNFSRSHVIRPGRFLFLQNDTYETAGRAGLTLDQKLSAVYFPDEAKLLFHNFRTVNSFLPLIEFYEEASEDEIRDVLDHDLLAPEDADALAVNANQWFRKCFAMLRDSSILDTYSATHIQRRSAGYDVDIHVVDHKLVFPAEKAAAKKLLQFLNEELFRGAITETLYETNSKRGAD